jgi:hypothetical protein
VVFLKALFYRNRIEQKWCRRIAEAPVHHQLMRRICEGKVKCEEPLTFVI